MRTATRKLVLTSVLAALSLVLAVTPLGLIPVPNVSGGATVMHVPALVGGILAGPLAGSLLGLVLAFATIPLFLGLGVNLAACFIPRLLIGVVAFLVWSGLGKRDLAVLAAALAGTFVNTIGVLGIAVLAGDFTWPMVVPVILLNGSLELVISAVVVVPVVRMIQKSGGANDAFSH